MTIIPNGNNIDNVDSKKVLIEDLQFRYKVALISLPVVGIVTLIIIIVSVVFTVVISSGDCTRISYCTDDVSTGKEAEIWSKYLLHCNHSLEAGRWKSSKYSNAKNVSCPLPSALLPVCNIYLNVISGLLLGLHCHFSKSLPLISNNEEPQSAVCTECICDSRRHDCSSARNGILWAATSITGILLIFDIAMCKRIRWKLHNITPVISPKQVYYTVK